MTRDQLSTYALVYRELTGQDADSIETYELKDRERRLQPVSVSLLKEMEARTKAAVDALRGNELPPVPESEKCQRCDVHDLCPASMDGTGSG